MTATTTTTTTITPALLAAKQAAAYLGISVRALRRLDIEPVHFPGRGTGARPRLMYRRVDLDAFIARMASTVKRRPLVRRRRAGAAARAAA